jgi:hypothetical protein
LTAASAAPTSIVFAVKELIFSLSRGDDHAGPRFDLVDRRAVHLGHREHGPEYDRPAR